MEDLTEAVTDVTVKKTEIDTRIETLVRSLESINACVSEEIFNLLMDEILLGYSEDIQKLVKLRYFKACNEEKLRSDKPVLTGWALD